MRLCFFGFVGEAQQEATTAGTTKFEEIQRSNMSKLGENGEPVYREDGKVLKGPNYFKPNIESILGK